MKLFVVLALCLAACSAAPQTRIVGGDDAVPGQVPYQANLRIGGLPTCGVVILSPTYALTALQCVASQGSANPWPPQLFTVSAGSVDLYTGRVENRVAEIIVNPNYSDLSVGIALLRLSEAFVFSDLIQSIPLSKTAAPIGATVEISGWGRVRDADEDMVRTLQINEGTVIDSSVCGNLLARSLSLQELCISSPRKNGICRGDFGGPAVYNGKLVGLAAYVAGECGSELPDVFTSISANYDWIVKQASL